MADQKMQQGTDFILMAMVAVAAADGKLDEQEIVLIQQIYRDQSGRSLTPEEIRAVEETNMRDGGLLAMLTAASDSLNMEAKEEIIRASYLVLLADDRIAGEERKKLQDIAAALRVPEIHFGAILEDLAIWLSGQKA
jgi:tellurite resistance protein